MTIGFGGAKTVDHVDSGSKEHAVAVQTGDMAQSGRQVAFPNASGANKNDVGVRGKELEFEEMFDLHAVDLGRPVPVPPGHGFDHREASVAYPALDAFVMAQSNLTGDEFLEELEMAATIASGLFGRWYGIFE